MEFKPFQEIKRLNKIEMNITQKIHGSNAQIVIEDVTAGPMSMYDVCINDKYYRITAGSRNRWVTPDNDNYGFASYVKANAVEIVEKLGVGQHFGEWAGPGINSGEGLTERTLVLFDFWKYPPERPLPPRMMVVPVLYNGVFDITKIDEVMNDLKTNGSKLVPGFMKPEGVVIGMMGTRFKKVFDAEETQWKNNTKPKRDRPPKVDVTYLLQPIRLEKLLSRDEAYIKNYPNSLPQICKDYVADLEKEGQFEGAPEDIRKHLSGPLFGFIKENVK